MLSLSLARNALFRKSSTSSMISRRASSSFFSLRNLVPFEYTVKYEYSDGTGKKTIDKVWTNAPPPPPPPPALFCDLQKAKVCPPPPHQKCGGVSGIYGHGSCTRSFSSSSTNKTGGGGKKNEIDVYKDRSVGSQRDQVGHSAVGSQRDQVAPNRGVGSGTDQDQKGQPATYVARGLDDYLRATWKYTGYNLGITAAGSSAAALSAVSIVSLVTDANSQMFILGGGFIASFGYGIYSAYKLGAIEPVFEKDLVTGGMRLEEGHETNIARKDYARNLFLAQGVVILPALALGFACGVLPQALALTAAATAGPIAASFMLPKKWNLAQYESVAMTALFGVVVSAIGGIWIPVLHDISTYGGVLVFTLFNAYDTHVAIEEYKSGRPDYIGHAANYGLNIVNLLVRFIEILAKSKK